MSDVQRQENTDVRAQAKSKFTLPPPLHASQALKGLGEPTHIGEADLHSVKC